MLLGIIAAVGAVTILTVCFTIFSAISDNKKTVQEGGGKEKEEANHARNVENMACLPTNSVQYENQLDYMPDHAELAERHKRIHR